MKAGGGEEGGVSGARVRQEIKADYAPLERRATTAALAFLRPVAIFRNMQR